MSNNNQDPTPAELLHRLADLWKEYADFCEQQADEMMKKLLDQR
jgi:hypothetical protein